MCCITVVDSVGYFESKQGLEPVMCRYVSSKFVAHACDGRWGTLFFARDVS